LLDHPKTQAKQSDIQGSAMSILIVDDNTMLLSKIVRSLSLAHHHVRSAPSIREARDILKAHSPQIICLDLQLPDGNGLDLLREIRETDQTTPVVIISGHHSQQHREKAEALGATGFLAKPFALSDLHKMLERLLAGSAETPEAANLQEDKAETPSPAKYRKLTTARLERAKWAYSTRHIRQEAARQLITRNYHPQPGDLVLARADGLNQHKHLELANGRRATLFIGDEIVVCYGNRYAPDQFEAEIPKDLSSCNLVATGGIAASCLSRNDQVQPPTRITPIGVLADGDGKPINLDQFACEERSVPERRPTITAVIGTSMNAGEATTSASLVHGLNRMGLKVGAAKLTGTAGDVWHLSDAGAETVYDFTDCGVPSTYKLTTDHCQEIMETLVAHLCETDADNILLELADGILQEETRALLQSPLFARLVDNVVIAAGDALGAAGGLSWLRKQGLEVLAVSGALTAAPLAIRECERLIDVPVLTLQKLNRGRWQLDNLSAKRRKSGAQTLVATLKSGPQAA
jgi:DNA-binding response OmpR family regulator